MPTKTKTAKTKTATLKVGTELTFNGYQEGAEGPLTKGEKLSVIGFDPSEGTYAVENEEGARDNLFPAEFSVGAPTPKAATKKVAKAKPAAEDEEEVVKTVKKTASKVKTETETAIKDKAKAKTTAKAKENKKEEPVELPAFKTTPSVKAALESHGGSALKAAHELAESSEKTIFTLGGVLAYIKRNDAHTEILSDERDEETGKRLPAYEAGLKGFNAYVQDVLGIAARRADYFVNLYEKFSQITTEAKIGKIGWTKLRELLPLALTKDNVEDWLDKAKASSTAELKESVTKTLVNSGEKVHGNRDTSEKTVRKFVFFDDQENVVNEAISRAKEVIGEEATDSQALLHIVTEWLNFEEAEPELSDDYEEEEEEDYDDE